MQLTKFQHEAFGSVRVATINGEVFFVGKDVAEILGYSNPSKALIDHVEEEDKLNNESLLSLGQRGGWLINESGLYALIFSSHMPKARQFKRWVTSEVLPSIRKHGLYATDELLQNPDFLIRALEELKAERAMRKDLEIVTRVQSQQIAELQPKASYCDIVIQRTSLRYRRQCGHELRLRRLPIHHQERRLQRLRQRKHHCLKVH